MADAGSSFYDFSDLLGSEELSDLTLVLIAGVEDATEQSEPPAKRQRRAEQETPDAAAELKENEEHAEEPQQIEELMPGHGLVLLGCSPVFKAQLMRWKQQAGEQQSDRPRIVLRVDSAAELGAARALVQFMYQRRLPEDALQQLLVTMLQLADRYDVQPCAVACGAALSKLELEPDTLQHVLQLPPSYSESLLFSSLFSKAADQLQQEFGDLEVVLANDEKAERFLALPLKGVELILGDKRTKVAYENTALVAATQWVHQHSDSLAAEDKVCLAGLIRCPFFTPFFASTVAMLTPWFVAALGVATVAAGMGIANAIRGNGACDMEKIKSTVEDFQWPASWAQGARPEPAFKELLLEWRVSLKELEAVFDGEGNVGLISPYMLFGGYAWCMVIGREQKDGAGASLGMYLKPGVPSEMRLPKSSMSAAMAVAACITCAGADQSQPREMVYDEDDYPIHCGRGRGVSDFWDIGPLSAWDAARFAPWSNSSGQLTLQLTVSKIL